MDGSGNAHISITDGANPMAAIHVGKYTILYETSLWSDLATAQIHIIYAFLETMMNLKPGNYNQKS